MRKSIIPFLLLFVVVSGIAQKNKVKYGDVKAEDFKKTVYEIDSNANAVVLYNYGTARHEGNSKGFFNVVYRFHKRVRLLNKNSFDLATAYIHLDVSNNGMEEKIEKLEATTYNMENGKLVATKIDKSSVFKDKVSKDEVVYKFTMPNIKEGSIIEYQYTLSSPYERYLKSWYFQGNDPVLWSEYDITVPAIFNFVMLKQGYHPYTIDTVVTGSELYSIIIPGESVNERNENYSFTSNTYHSTWAMKDIPALKKESYTTTLGNYISKIEFQISSLRYPEQAARPMMRTWNQLAGDLLKNTYFGADLGAKNGWLNDDMVKVTQAVTTDYDKAKKVYEFVRDNFTCTDHSAIYLTENIKKAYQAKSGNVADINLLLTAMLKNRGLDAAPVLLSTREHGKTYDLYPLLGKFNYVVCRLTIDTTSYLLDASQNKNGFGKLPEECYNGSARIIATEPKLLNLLPESITENKLTSVFIANESKGNISGSFNSKLGYYESTDLRERLAKTTNEEFFKDIKKSYPFEVEIDKGEITELKNLDEPAAIKYAFKTPLNDEDIVYFNPLLTEAYKTNPFKSAQRFYPVEMPYPVNETYLLTMDVPEGYKVDELPKSVRVNYNEDEGKFEYIIKNNNGVIQMRCSIVLNKATFQPDEYDNLRDFFAFVVKKQSEQIVFKKIK